LPFQPAIGLEIGGNAILAIGEHAGYQIKIPDTSSVDTPPLILDGLTEDLLGDLTGIAIVVGCGTLLAGTSCASKVERLLQSGASDPLIDNATANYQPQGLPDVVTGTDSHSVDLLQPSVEVTVGGDATAQVGDQSQWRLYLLVAEWNPNRGN